jgi:hypothetical protein
MPVDEVTTPPHPRRARRAPGEEEAAVAVADVVQWNPGDDLCVAGEVLSEGAA